MSDSPFEHIRTIRVSNRFEYIRSK